MRRRTFLASTAAATLAAPRIGNAQAAKPLRFVPDADLAIVDPIVTTSYQTRDHGYMVFDTEAHKEEARFESLMLGLRMTRGVKDEDFTRMHGMSIRATFGEKLDKPISGGLLEWHEGALRLTRLGMDMENSVLVDLL